MVQIFQARELESQNLEVFSRSFSVANTFPLEKLTFSSTKMTLVCSDIKVCPDGRISSSEWPELKELY